MAEKRSVKELLEILTDAGVEVPTEAKKADLVELAVAESLRQAAADAAGG